MAEYKKMEKPINFCSRSHAIFSKTSAEKPTKPRIYSTWATLKKTKKHESSQRFVSLLSHCRLADRVFFSVNIGTCTLQVWTWLYAGNGCFLLLTFSNFPALELNAPLWDFIIRGCSFWPIQGKYSLLFAWNLCTALPPSKFQQRPWRQQMVEI